MRYPLGADTRIEGGRDSDGDRHAIIVETGTCRLYELYATRVSGSRWSAGSGAVWSLKQQQAAPATGGPPPTPPACRSCPGLLRWNEVKAGKVDHAIRFTTDVTSRHHLWPARHDAGSTSSLAYPPMGARFRLKAS